MNTERNIIQMVNFKKMDLILEHYGNFGFQSVDSYIHRHADYYEIILGISGSFEHTYNGKTTALNRGDLLLLTPYSTHQLYTEPLQATHFVICIEQNYFSAFVAQHFPDFSADALPELSTFHLGQKETDYLELLCQELTKASPSRYSAETFTFITLMSIFTKTNTKHSYNAYYVNRLISLLNNPNNFSISIQSLCAQFPESVPTILKNFKKQTGCTIVQYKNKKKMELAAKMLRDTPMTVTDIAYDLHYESLSYFLRAFKQEYRITPTEYRRKYTSD